MATIQGTRFRWTFPLLSWLRPLPYWSQLGWIKIYLDIGSRPLFHHHRPRHPGRFRLVRSFRVQRTGSYAAADF